MLLVLQEHEEELQVNKRVVKCFNCQREDPCIAEGPVTQTVITNNASYQADDLDAYNSYCDDITTAQVALMANLSRYGLHVLSEDTNSSVQQDAMILSVFEQLSHQVINCNKVNKNNLIANESLSDELERYKERVKLLEERKNVDLSIREKLIINDFEKEINSLKQTLSEQLKEKESLTITFHVFKNKSKEKETKNINKEIALEKKVKELDNIVNKLGQSAQMIRRMLYDSNVIAKETNVISIADSEETLMLEEKSRSKMLLKQSDPMILEKKVNIKPVNYAVLNQLSDDFEKCFVPQQELSGEQAFWFQMSNPSNGSSDPSPVKVDVPSELPKVSLVNTSLKKLKSHLAKFDFVAKTRITPFALTEVDINDSENVNVNSIEMCNKYLELEAELIKQHNMDNTSVNQIEPTFNQMFELNNLRVKLQAKDTTIKKLKAQIKCMLETSTSKYVKKDIDEIKTINIELEHTVSKLIAENEHLKQTYKQLYDSIKPTRIRTKEHCEALIDQLNEKSVKNSNLNAQLQEKVSVITTSKNDLRKLKGKDTVDNAVQALDATTIAPGMYKLDPVILAPRNKNNRKTHIYYLKHTIEQAAILREIVKQATLLNLLDSASYTACKYVKLIQELLSYVRDTCPDIHKSSEKLVAVTPMN
nr:integrase, catalytic region, zinc finger, CCHC-type, peptidase aspartic, catalytic [Tanacetum cinerariifolium]